MFYPIAADFLINVTLTLPFNPASFPSGITEDDVILLAQAERDWIELPSMLHFGDETVSVTTGAFDIGPFIAVVNKPLESGQVLIETSPAYASVHTGGKKIGRTPLLLENLF